MVVGCVLPGVPRSCLASGKAKNLFQCSRPGYGVEGWGCSLGLLDRLKGGIMGSGQCLPFVPRTAPASGIAVGPSVEPGGGG